jgi:multisubunit Na+/H+ antiporter MnhC subunit
MITAIVIWIVLVALVCAFMYGANKVKNLPQPETDEETETDDTVIF